VTHIDDYVAQAKVGTSNFMKCSPEQALVYSCEDVVDEVAGSRIISAVEITALLDNICQKEDIDTPELVFSRSSPRFKASVDLDTNTICVRGRNTSVLVLLHEVAHVSVGIESHGVIFRNELVRLVRTHVSVDSAALLHTLFVRTGLDAAPWVASAFRPH